MHSNIRTIIPTFNRIDVPALYDRTCFWSNSHFHFKFRPDEAASGNIFTDFTNLQWGQTMKNIKLPNKIIFCNLKLSNKIVANYNIDIDT